MNQVPLDNAIKMMSGFEAMQRGDFTHDDALYFAVIHNQTHEKSIYRSARDVMIEDGMESVVGTIKEWTKSVSHTIADLFKDYNKQEAARIEKEFKGGAAAFKEASIKDAIEAAKRVRGIVSNKFDVVYEQHKLASRPYFKGMSKKEAKEKMLKDIDRAIEGMSSSKMTDFYMSQIKKNSEKYMLKIVSKISYLKNTHVKYKNLLDKKQIHGFMMSTGFNPTKLEEIRKGGDQIIRKLEMIDKNGTVFLDIVKSKIFIDLENYVKNIFLILNMMLERLETTHKAIDKTTPGDKVTVNGHEYNSTELRGIVMSILSYVHVTYDAINDLSEEMSDNITRTSFSMTGIPEYCVDAFIDHEK